MSKVSYRLALPDETGEYTTSFTIDQEANIREFFETYGFVVLRDALTPGECEESKGAIFDLIEEATGGRFVRDDYSTWGNFPKDSLEQYGSPQISPIFRAQILRNRQNPNVYRLFAMLLGNDDLLVNHDRCCFFRPHDLNPSWGTKANIHLDMNPWNWLTGNEEEREKLEALQYDRDSNFIYENNQPTVFDGTQLQGVINLNDNHSLDGGFVTVPGFHREFNEYFAAIPPRPQTSFNFKENSDPFKRAVRVAMRAGSVVVWDQRMAHGSFPNRSEVPRFAQFIKMFPRATVSAGRQRFRASAVQRHLRPLLSAGPVSSSSRKSQFVMNDIGRIVFGVDHWENNNFEADEDVGYTQSLNEAL